MDRLEMELLRQQLLTGEASLLGKFYEARIRRQLVLRPIRDAEDHTDGKAESFSDAINRAQRYQR
jgi:hypothetical protein